ncbi:MAG: ABC transporter ATP-binding protein [Clostridiales bacterium]|nr:ABC transporter ATP-binding protein [Clostridiales bacterium]
MEELAIKIEHVSKQYRLGAIGGGSLKGDLQSWWARKRGKEDPNSKIGARTDIKTGEKFLALDDINLEIKKGEALGIIGHNGAGKSTLLKLLSRVTAPTTGTIGINGRIASMLEVGTGFHPELTGRENIYMNGAILGMTKKEIDSKIEEIIDFSEVRQFIDTPVKRYSSGMYVKLAFSVAAHLDSEIMIMDEVLAVGDMAFQKKCLTKMREAADQEGRTVLYVSHNMNTIRQLCDRCVVMDHGHIIFDGGVEEAIALYMGFNRENYSNHIFINPNMRDPNWPSPEVTIEEIKLDTPNGYIQFGERLVFSLRVQSRLDRDADVFVRVMIKTAAGSPITMSAVDSPITIPSNGETTKEFELNTSLLIPASYYLSFVLYEIGNIGADNNLDVLRDICSVTVISSDSFNNGMAWNPQWWGNISIGALKRGE